MSSVGDDDVSGAGKRRYESPLRRAQARATRERILEAASEMVREFQSWDWRPLTFRAVAERAGIGERTVYRHFPTVRVLHEAVMQQLHRDSGVEYDGITLDDVATIGAKVFSAMSEFEAPAGADPDDPIFLAEHRRRQAALLAAVDAGAEGWTEEEQMHAAAALDVLWTAPSYHRLVAGWQLDAEEAGQVIEWMISLVISAIRDGQPPGGRR